MRVLVVGSGGREHALVWKLSQSPALTDLHAAPGNPGIGRHATCHPVTQTEANRIVQLCHARRIDLVVIGPEAPLVAGLADRLRADGFAVFGPSARAAMIEGSKSFAKEIMRASGVPTARILSKPRPPCVVKADGLAAGKGVFVCPTQIDVDEALRQAAAFGGDVFVEELLEGRGDLAVSPLPTAEGRSFRSFPRRTQSACSTATRGRTPVAWAATHRFPV